MESTDDLFTWNESADEVEWTEDDVHNFDNFLQTFDDKQYITIKPKQVIVVQKKVADEKKYLCAKCGKYFTRRWCLKRHTPWGHTLKIHNQEVYTHKLMPGGECMICHTEVFPETRCETTPTIDPQIFNFTL